MSLKLFGQKETAGLSTDTALTRKECEAGCDHKPGRKNCAMKQSSGLTFRADLRESNPGSGEAIGRRFRVTLLREGLGNFGDCFYYTAAAIQSAVPVFEGKQFFLNHPSNSEEMDRPERMVQDISGYYENVKAEQAQDGAFKLTADLVMPMSSAFERERALMLESLDYSQKHGGKDLVGLSINADGDSSTMGLEQFMHENVIPESCKEKLLEALQRGITEIRPVQEITSAISCDLVTQAGAGGRIDQLLEQEKDTMKVKTKEGHKEDEAKKEKKEGQDPADAGQAPKDPKESDGDGDADDQDAQGQDGSHPDAEQDEQLIAKMLDKYLGEPAHDEESMKLGKEAYQNAIEMGMDHEEAMKCAGYNMKMAKHMASKSGAPKDVQPAPKPVPSDQEQPQESEGKKEAVKESSKGSNRIVALTAENARLKAELDGLKLEKFVDKTLKESKLPMSATKRFKECIKDAKTEKEVTEKFNVFKEAFSLGGEAEGLGFIIGAEKQTEGATGGLSFADCVEE